MRYTYFEFENFKGIRKARLELNPDSRVRIYSLVGLNESGKTTVLEAIDLFQGTEEDEVSPKALAGWVPPYYNSIVPIADQANFNGSIEVTAGVELDEDDLEAARNHLARETNFRLEDISREIQIRDEYSYEASSFQRRQTWWTGLTARGKRGRGHVARVVGPDNNRKEWDELALFLRSRLPTIWFFPNFLFEFPAKIYLEDHPEDTDADRFYRSLFQDILYAVDEDLSIETHVVTRARSGKGKDRDNLEQVLLKAGRHVTGQVVRSWNRIFADRPMQDKAVRLQLEIEADEDLPDGTTREGRIAVTFQIEDGDGIFLVSERSLGFRWFFVYLMITTYRGHKTNSPSDMLFLFDEPASNLHPTAQVELLSSLESLSKNAGIIYTTHSHHLINPEWLGTTFVVANEGLGEDAVSLTYSSNRTDIRVTPYRHFASHHPDQAHFFQPILDVLDYAPSRLELVPEAIMLEGKSDYYVLSYFQTVLNVTKPGETLSFMPGGGAGSLDSLIQLYLGWSRSFVVLLDSDKAGEAQRARYLEKFGPVLRPHLMSLEEASEKAGVKGIESLLYESDMLKFQGLTGDESGVVRKKTFLLGVQEALIARREIELTKTSQKVVAKTLASLRRRLFELRTGDQTPTKSDRST